jgi:hypothetical protein
MKNLTILALAVTVIGVFGCKKLNTIDNSGTIKQPYVLYIGGLFGNLQKTNDAENFDTPYLNDGSLSFDVIVADTNIIHVRNKIHVANNNKPNYAPVTMGNFTTISNAVTNPITDKYVNVTLYDAINKNVYVITKEVAANKGIIIGQYNGKSFANDMNVNTVDQPYATTITQTKNGDIFVKGENKLVNTDQALYVRKGGLLTNTWTRVVPSTTAANVLPKLNGWILGSIDNRLIAVNKYGYDTAMYSDNFGADWFPLAGLPDSVTTQCVKTCVLNNKLYVGTDSAGLWRLDGTTFVKSSNGLPATARIFDIVSKRNVYRTDVSKDYYFLATDKGLFISDFNATQWKQVHDKACMAFD